MEYNSLRMRVELHSDRSKQFDDSKTKLLAESDGLVGSMKEYLMKIIEVLLDTGEEEIRPKKDKQKNKIKQEEKDGKQAVD